MRNARRHLARSALAALVPALALTTLPSPVRAGMFDVYGFGSRALSLGGAMTAAADDHTAVYYNPAALTGHDTVHLGVDLYTVLPDLAIQPTRVIPDGLRPEPVGSHSGASFGVLFPFGGKLENRFALGLGVHVPFGGLLDAEFLDPQVPQWYRYNHLPKKLHVVAGASYQPWRFLHVGLGAQVLADVDGGATVGLDLTNQQLPRRDVTAELVTTASPTAGLLVEPPFTPGLRLGFTFRDELGLHIALPILFDLGETLDFLVAVEGISLYTPRQFAWGAAFDLDPTTGLPLLLTADLTLEQWSRAPSPELDVLIDVSGDLIAGLGFDEALDFSAGALPAPGFQDAWALRVGAEADVTRNLTLRAGYTWRSAALGPQTGFTNYVDATSHAIGLGGGVSFPDPLEIDEHDVTIEVAAQFLLVPQHQHPKNNPDDPIGTFSANGQTTTLCLSLRHDF